MERYVCVHGHFYQPPRENPWLETVEAQESAAPYHDWNARITTECYAPNARSRILDEEGRIYRIANNYARISFNVGPTLLKWLEDEKPEVYDAILQADRESAERFSGHGSAIAQAFNHIIMPLANSRDKYTQVLWGIRDFQHRFGRKPEGMWLPETAVDTETLDIMAGLGIKFTVLEPGQARRFKPSGAHAWEEGAIDSTRSYSIGLPSGRRISVFFYDGPISRAIAFEGLLASGETFSGRLMSGFSDERDWPQIVNIATDGESYGHHHRFGDMALAYTLDRVEREGFVKLTNYAEYLDNHPPQHEAEIAENTSWSCGHGVERWRANCGCNSGGRPEWDQEWRAPLREALDWLRDRVGPDYERRAFEYFRDPWDARNEYIEVILNRDDDNLQAFFATHGVDGLPKEDWVPALKLLELQRHAMLMFTSCGWFFDDLSGIETVQVIQYAGRVIQLAQELFGDHIEDEFLDLLAAARSNLPEMGDGRAVYERAVRPAMVDLKKVGAHFAVNSLFEDYAPQTRIYCYNVDEQDYERKNAGSAQIAVGRAELTSVITREASALSFGVLHFADHNITAGVRDYGGDGAYSEMKAEAIETFDRGDLPEVIRVLDRHFGALTYSLKSLFRDEQRKVLDTILASTVADAEQSYRQVFERAAPLMRSLTGLGIPLPKAFQAAGELVLNANLRVALTAEPIDPERVQVVLEDLRTWHVEPDEAAMAFVAARTLEGLARRFALRASDADTLRALRQTAEAVAALPFAVDLFEAQNRFWQVVETAYPGYRQRAERGEADAVAWVEDFRILGAKLSVRVD